MNKSKFLKKSLAMLLALMLVLAMIPLSASAATLPDIEFIYVNGSKVTLADEMTVDVSDTATYVKIGTNVDLSKHQVEMVATVKVAGLDKEQPIGQSLEGTQVDLDPYAPDDVITLVIYPTDGSVRNPMKTYKLNLKRTTDNTTTDLEKVEAVQDTGVYSIDNSIDDINATRTVKVIAAYDDGTNASAPAPEMTVYTKDHATVNNNEEEGVSAADDAKFEVVSQSKNNTAEYTVETTYVDALNTITIDGVAGLITDEDDDDYMDTITVTLPKEAVLDEYGDPVANPKFNVEFTMYAQTGTISIDSGDPISSPAEVTFTGLADGADYQEDLVTTVIGGVQQTYELNVKIAKDTDSSIDRVVITAGKGVEELARPDGKTIDVELPSNATDTATVDIYTPSTVTGVAIAGTDVTGHTTVGNLEKWTAYGVNVTTPKTITVTAQDNTITEYTLNVTKATEVKEPAINSVSIEDDETGIVYSGTPDSNRVIEIEVPYMTINVTDWIVRVTPADGSNVINSLGNAIPSGQYKMSGVITTSTVVDETNGLSFTLDAVAKGNTTDKKSYTVKIVLAEPGSGKTLESLEFTSQKAASGKTLNDETVFRALNDDNTFEAKIDQSKKTITLSPALSLAQDDYEHIVTNFTTAEGGVVFTANSNVRDGQNFYATTNDEKTNGVTGFKLGEDETANTRVIVVAPEAIAREAAKSIEAGTNYNFRDADPEVLKNCTVYTIEIDPAPALKEADLKTFKIGDVELKVSGNKITGELPWSYTVNNASDTSATKFAEYTIGKYATLVDNTGDWPYNSKGDEDGDGDEELRSATNHGFTFVRDTSSKENKVNVYRAGAGSDNAAIESIIVKAEDRLNTGSDKTSKTYDFELTYAEPEIEANIESFKLGNYTGTISGNNITVRVPYKTDLKGMVATFTTSTGATVKYGTEKVESGKTVLNYSSPIKLVVHSEKLKDGSTTESVTVKTYTVTVTEAEMFTDVSSSKWYYDYVLKASNLGIINGRGDGIFAPEENVTRGDFAVMLTNMLGVKELPHVENNPLYDVDEDKYYSDAIAYCYDQGYIGGYPDGSYKPEQSITRQEAAKIIAEALELTETTSDLFTDDSRIDQWAEEYVYQCKAAGIFGGDADTGNFRPTDAISRAETAKIMVEAYNNK